VVLVVLGLVCAGVRALFRVFAHHPAEAWVSGGMAAVLIAVIFGVCLWNRAEDKRVPVVKVPDGPVCVHRDAVRVDSVLDRDKTVAWWCPACDTQLDPGFRASELRAGNVAPVRKPS
jgi:hypothetical protein